MSEPRQLPPELVLDYQTTVDMIKMLTDLRFRLLAFVPAVSGLAVSLLGKSPDNATVLGVGILGFTVTLGIVLYDLRNSQIYNLSMHRAKWLEYILDMPRLTTLEWQQPYQPHYHGGLVTERPFRLYWLFGIGKLKAKHDRALALIYAASLGGWTYLIVTSLASLLVSQFVDSSKHPELQSCTSIGSILLALVTAWLFARELNRLDSLGEEQLDKAKKATKQDREKAESKRANNMPPRPLAELQELQKWYNRPRSGIVEQVAIEREIPRSPWNRYPEVM